MILMQKNLLIVRILMVGSLSYCAPTQAISVSSYQASQVVISSKGSDGTLQMGQRNNVAQFRIQNRGDKSLALEYLELKNYGNADLTESFDTWEMIINSQTIPAWTWSDQRSIAIMLPEPVIIGRGDSIIVQVQAQLILARNNKTVQLGLRRADDIDLREIHTNVYAEVLSEDNTKFTEHQLRPGGIYFRRTPRRTYRR